MNKKERNAMFKIHDDKVYFVAETPDINKVIEIFLPNGTFVSEDLVPMSLLQSVVSYGCEYWNRDFPE